MKTTSQITSEKAHKTYLSKGFFTQMGDSLSESAEISNPKSFIRNLINHNKDLSNIAERFFWACEEVPQDVLVEAWTHKSFLNELSVVSNYSSYERWEFLGDAIFGSFITRQLFQKFPNKTEGQLSKLKSQLVAGEMLALIAESCGLDKLILLGRGEVKRYSHKNPSLLADIFEATIGVVSNYLDQNTVDEFIGRLIDEYEKSSGEKFYHVESLLKKEVKGELQELTMKRFKLLPDYQSKEISNGFEVKLFVDGKLYGQQIHQSKKTAQKLCAEQAIKELKN